MVEFDQRCLIDLIEHYKCRNQKIGEHTEIVTKRMKILESTLPTLVIWDKWQNSNSQTKIDVEELIKAQMELRKRPKSAMARFGGPAYREQIHEPRAVCSDLKVNPILNDTNRTPNKLQYIRKLQEFVTKEKLIKNKIKELEKQEAKYKVVLEDLARNSNKAMKDLSMMNNFCCDNARMICDSKMTVESFSKSCDHVTEKNSLLDSFRAKTPKILRKRLGDSLSPPASILSKIRARKDANDNQSEVAADQKLENKSVSLKTGSKLVKKSRTVCCESSITVSVRKRSVTYTSDTKFHGEGEKNVQQSFETCKDAMSEKQVKTENLFMGNCTWSNNPSSTLTDSKTFLKPIKLYAAPNCNDWTEDSILSSPETSSCIFARNTSQSDAVESLAANPAPNCSLNQNAIKEPTNLPLNENITEQKAEMIVCSSKANSHESQGKTVTGLLKLQKKANGTKSQSCKLCQSCGNQKRVQDVTSITLKETTEKTTNPDFDASNVSSPSKPGGFDEPMVKEVLSKLQETLSYPKVIKKQDPSGSNNIVISIATPELKNEPTTVSLFIGQRVIPIHPISPDSLWATSNRPLSSPAAVQTTIENFIPITEETQDLIIYQNPTNNTIVQESSSGKIAPNQRPVLVALDETTDKFTNVPDQVKTKRTINKRLLINKNPSIDITPTVPKISGLPETLPVTMSDENTIAPVTGSKRSSLTVADKKEPTKILEASKPKEGLESNKSSKIVKPIIDKKSIVSIKHQKCFKQKSRNNNFIFKRAPKLTTPLKSRRVNLSKSDIAITDVIEHTADTVPHQNVAELPREETNAPQTCPSDTLVQDGTARNPRNCKPSGICKAPQASTEVCAQSNHGMSEILTADQRVGVEAFRKAIARGTNKKQQKALMKLAKNLCGAVADIFGEFSNLDNQFIKTFTDITTTVRESPIAESLEEDFQEERFIGFPDPDKLSPGTQQSLNASDKFCTSPPDQMKSTQKSRIVSDKFCTSPSDQIKSRSTNLPGTLTRQKVPENFNCSEYQSACKMNFIYDSGCSLQKKPGKNSAVRFQEGCKPCDGGNCKCGCKKCSEGDVSKFSKDEPSITSSTLSSYPDEMDSVKCLRYNKKVEKKIMKPLTPKEFANLNQINDNRCKINLEQETSVDPSPTRSHRIPTRLKAGYAPEILNTVISPIAVSNSSNKSENLSTKSSYQNFYIEDCPIVAPPFIIMNSQNSVGMGSSIVQTNLVGRTFLDEGSTKKSTGCGDGSTRDSAFDFGKYVLPIDTNEPSSARTVVKQLPIDMIPCSDSDYATPSHRSRKVESGFDKSQQNYRSVGYSEKPERPLEKPKTTLRLVKSPQKSEIQSQKFEVNKDLSWLPKIEKFIQTFGRNANAEKNFKTKNDYIDAFRQVIIPKKRSFDVKGKPLNDSSGIDDEYASAASTFERNQNKKTIIPVLISKRELSKETIGTIENYPPSKKPSKDRRTSSNAKVRKYWRELAKKPDDQDPNGTNFNMICHCCDPCSCSPCNKNRMEGRCTCKPPCGCVNCDANGPESQRFWGNMPKNFWKELPKKPFNQEVRERNLTPTCQCCDPCSCHPCNKSPGKTHPQANYSPSQLSHASRNSDMKESSSKITQFKSHCDCIVCECDCTADIPQKCCIYESVNDKNEPCECPKPCQCKGSVSKRGTIDGSPGSLQDPCPQPSKCAARKIKLILKCSLCNRSYTSCVCADVNAQPWSKPGSRDSTPATSPRLSEVSPTTRSKAGSRDSTPRTSLRLSEVNPSQRSNAGSRDSSHRTSPRQSEANPSTRSRTGSRDSTHGTSPRQLEVNPTRSKTGIRDSPYGTSPRHSDVNPRAWSKPGSRDSTLGTSPRLSKGGCDIETGECDEEKEQAVSTPRAVRTPQAAEVSSARLSNISAKLRDATEKLRASQTNCGCKLKCVCNMNKTMPSSPEMFNNTQVRSKPSEIVSGFATSEYSHARSLPKSADSEYSHARSQPKSATPEFSHARSQPKSATSGYLYGPTRPLPNAHSSQYTHVRTITPPRSATSHYVNDPPSPPPKSTTSQYSHGPSSVRLKEVNSPYLHDQPSIPPESATSRYSHSQPKTPKSTNSQYSHGQPSIPPGSASSRYSHSPPKTPLKSANSQYSHGQASTPPRSPPSHGSHGRASHDHAEPYIQLIGHGIDCTCSLCKSNLVPKVIHAKNCMCCMCQVCRRGMDARGISPENSRSLDSLKSDKGIDHRKSRLSSKTLSEESFAAKESHEESLSSPKNSGHSDRNRSSSHHSRSNESLSISKKSGHSNQNRLNADRSRSKESLVSQETVSHSGGKRLSTVHSLSEESVESVEKSVHSGSLESSRAAETSWDHVTEMKIENTNIREIEKKPETKNKKSKMNKPRKNKTKSQPGSQNRFSIQKPDYCNPHSSYFIRPVSARSARSTKSKPSVPKTGASPLKTADKKPGVGFSGPGDNLEGSRSTSNRRTRRGFNQDTDKTKMVDNSCQPCACEDCTEERAPKVNRILIKKIENAVSAALDDHLCTNIENSMCLCRVTQKQPGCCSCKPKTHAELEVKDTKTTFSCCSCVYDNRSRYFLAPECESKANSSHGSESKRNKHKK